MRLSIVVPVYNERFLVGEMLSRLLRVEFPQVTATEIIAVDDDYIEKETSRITRRFNEIFQ